MYSLEIYVFSLEWHGISTSSYIHYNTVKVELFHLQLIFAISANDANQWQKALLFLTLEMTEENFHWLVKIIKSENVWIG